MAHAVRCLGGVRDPNKHDDAALQTFVEAQRAEFANEAWFVQARAAGMTPEAPGWDPPVITL